LESWASRLAAERASHEDRREAEQLIAELRSHLDSDNYESLLVTDRRIHRFVYRCAKNPFLAETLDHYYNLSLRILYVALRRSLPHPAARRGRPGAASHARSGLPG
jgi:DNA-binding GntR family transcriptional regulator